jgi:anti-anti-sigma regulatory factor
VKFEQSPPAWIDNAELSTDPRQSQAKERKDFFAFKGGKDMAGEIEKFRAFAEAQGSVRLDLSKIAAISADEATLLAQALQALRKKNLPMWFTGPEALEGLLRAGLQRKADVVHAPVLAGHVRALHPPREKRRVRGAQPRVRGRFRGVAARLGGLCELRVGRGEDLGRQGSRRREPRRKRFPIEGLVSIAAANQMSELTAYAASRSEVTLDMGKVSRIDFAYTNTFFETIKSMQLASKRVILGEPERAQRGDPRGDRREPLRDPGAPQVQLKSLHALS